MRHHSRPARERTGSPQRSVTRPSSHRVEVPDRLDADAARRDRSGLQRLVVEIRQDLPRPRIEVAGELDLDSAGLLTAMLDHVRRGRRRAGTAGARREGVDVDVDLAGVTFADSHGMAPVLDGRTCIVSASEPVRRLLHLLDGPVPAARDRQPEAQPRPA